MKVRITFTGDIEITVPMDTDMNKYLVDNAWELVKLAVDEASIIPDEWEEVEEEPKKK